MSGIIRTIKNYYKALNEKSGSSLDTLEMNSILCCLEQLEKIFNWYEELEAKIDRTNERIDKIEKAIGRLQC